MGNQSNRYDKYDHHWQVDEIYQNHQTCQQYQEQKESLPDTMLSAMLKSYYFLDTTDTVVDTHVLKKELYHKTIKMLQYGSSLFEDSRSDSGWVVDFMTSLFFALTTIAEQKEWMRITADDDKIIYTLHKHNKLVVSITDNELFNDLQGWMIEIPKGKIGVVCRKDDYRFKIETDDTVIRDRDFNLIANRQFTTKMDEVFRTVVDYLNH